MQTQPSDPGAADGATLSRPRHRGSRLRTAVVAASAFAAGALTVAAIPVARSWMNADPVVYSMVRTFPRGIQSTAAPDSDLSAYELTRHRRFQEEYLKSDRVLKPAVVAPAVRKVEWLASHPDPVGWLREHLQVDSREYTCFFRISVTGATLDDQVVLVNAVTDSHLRSYSEYMQGAYSGELKRTKAASITSREALAALRKSLVELEKKGDAAEASALRDEVAVKEELVRRLLSKIEELKLQEAFPASVELVHAAEPPKAK